ncbi:glucosamine-6-phosphate deaminase [Sanguibacter sp. A247]|uniref:glucosamine-6-phosphate deaminase n=1 Tax=unclassified Sanguibacter TaxID=2645534 RepID=UPI003FD7BCC8
MEIVILPSADAVGKVGADIFERVVRSTEHPVLGLATGSSPLPVYTELVRRHEDEDLSFANAEAFCLDEYIGLPVGHPESYHQFIRRVFTGHLDIADTAVHSPDGTATDIPAAGRSYDAAIAAAGGVDLQILGIGTNGHLAFNEPGSSLASRTRIVTLTEQTRTDNARFFDTLDDVPRYALTQGLGTIMEARHLLIVATGAGKAAAVAAAAEGPVTASCPASIAQMHPHVTLLVDEAAATDLVNAERYRYVYANKPEWQAS